MFTLRSVLKLGVFFADLHAAMQRSINTAEQFGIEKPEHLIEYVGYDAKSNWQLLANKKINALMAQNRSAATKLTDLALLV